MSDARAWLGVLAAPLAWAAQHVVGFGLSQAACNPVGHGAPLHDVSAAVGVAAAVVAAGGLLVARSVRRATDPEGPVADARRHFLGTVGIVVSPLMLCLIALNTVGVLSFEPCAIAAPKPGIARPPDERGLAPTELGRQLFAGNCASCHGSVAGRLRGRGPSLRGVGAQALDFYLSTGRMPLGSPDTVPQRHDPVFDRREIDALIAYVTSLPPPGPPIPQPHPERGDIARGTELFAERCAGCHQIVGRGGVVTGAPVPSLQDASPAQVAEAVRTGPYLMPSYSRRAISDRDLDSVIRYVLSTRAPDDRGGWGIGHIGPIPEGAITWLVVLTAIVGLCVLLGRRARQ